jgi:hypothetical protein
VSGLITSEGVLERRDDELLLTGYYPRPGETLESRLQRIKGGCGWELKVSPEISAVPPATLEELYIVRLLDPKGFFISVATKEEP